MGEKQIVRIDGFSPGALRQLTNAIRNGTSATPPAAAAPSPFAGPYYEPWSFYAPQEAEDVLAFLDDRQQVRHIPVSVVAQGVPSAWRQLFVRAPEPDPQDAS